MSVVVPASERRGTKRRPTRSGKDPKEQDAFSYLVPDLGDHIREVHVAARIAFMDVGFWIRVEPQRTWRHFPGLEQHTGIIDDRLIVQDVSFARQFFDHVHVVGMEISASIQPREVVKPDGVDDER